MPGLGDRFVEARRSSAARLAFDATHFLEALYRGQPDETVIVVGDLRRPHFCRSVESALHYVTGRQDVYVRVTLLAGRPDKGRGAAADSAWLPGVWAEVDVDGGPSASGGAVSGGAPTVEAALELAHAVLQPTLLVRSGYGLHAYWLLEAPLDIREPEARAQAGRLVEGWQRRLRAEGVELGIAGLDATHDLARVLRPAGTFNGKGGEPVPVVLLDDGGPRYTLEALEAEVLAPVVPIVAPAPAAAAPGKPRTPDELVARYSALGRIARHEGKAPKGGSPSDWDFYLACEARRRVKPPITRDEAAELVAYGRGQGDDPRGKGSRRDYLERTVDRAFAEVVAPGVPAAANADPVEVINRGWGIGADPFVNGWATGNGLDATVYLRREGGDVVRLRRFGDLFTSTKQVAQVSVVLPGVAVPDLSKQNAVRIAQAIRDVCGVREFDEVDRDELEAYVGAFVHGLGAELEGDLLGEGEPRWRVLVAQRDYQPREAGGIAGSTAGIRDLEGQLWIPAGAFLRYLRAVERAPLTAGELRTRLVDLGWTELRVDVHEPHSGTSKTGLRHIRAVFYGQPSS